MLKIQGKTPLSGTVNIGGSKNAALPLIAAALLLKGKTTLTNVPDISDTHDFLHFYESINAKVHFEKNTLTIDTSNIKLDTIDTSKISRTRAGIYFIAGLLHHFKEANIPLPGGDKIGKRPIDEHINGYIAMGYNFSDDNNMLSFSGQATKEDTELVAYFAVSATANLILGAATREATTKIKLAAFEPHIFNLIDFIRSIGVQVKIRYDHTIIIDGTKNIASETEHEVISDYLQSGTFAIIAALASENYLDIQNARIADLEAFLYKLHEAGVKTENLGNDTLRVYKAKKLQAVNIQTNIFPGFPTDLMPLFTVLMTQCEGTSRIHEVLYEGRLNWLVEYERLGCSPRIINLHEAKIMGPNNLQGNLVNSWDLRSGAAMLIAGIIAEGTTTVENVYWIHRGYDDIIGKLRSVGAEIEEIKNDNKA